MNIRNILQIICYILGIVALIQFIYMNHISIVDYWTGDREDQKK